jgi:NTP pyrophosphatase (non-canonical NTP hydrolase)
VIKNDLTDRNELLLVLMEECAEVSVEASKLMRFPENSLSDLEKEIGDLLCMLDLLHQWDYVRWTEIEKQAKRKKEKLKQFSHFMGEGYE